MATDVVTEIIQNIPLCNTIDVIVDACPVNIVQSLEQVQSDWDETSPNSPAYIKNKPDLNAYAELEDISTVGLTGNYDDLENKPTIPAAQVNSDWNSTSGVSEILNKPDLSIYAQSSDLATVATTGDYSDLSNTPDLSIYQETLISGENIKTINNQSLLGSGNIEIQGGGGGTQVQADWDETDPTSMAYINNKPDLSVYALESELQDYQPELVSGQNIKTINNESLLGSGNITIQSGSSEEVDTLAEASIKQTLDLEQDMSILEANVQTSIVKVMDDVDAKLNEADENKSVTDQVTAEALNDLHSTTQPLLVSGTNIKTINNESLLGSGNITIQGGGGAQVQSNWNETDNTSPAYIQNKPDLSIYAESSNLATVATSGNYADLLNTPTIPSAPVQSDWNETNTSSLAYIQNKPTIPAAQVQANWNESDNTSLAYIQNKPTIPSAPVQSDWNESDTTSLAYIQNKPNITSSATNYYVYFNWQRYTKAINGIDGIYINRVEVWDLTTQTKVYTKSTWTSTNYTLGAILSEISTQFGIRCDLTIDDTSISTSNLSFTLHNYSYYVMTLPQTIAGRDYGFGSTFKWVFYGWDSTNNVQKAQYNTIMIPVGSGLNSTVTSSTSGVKIEVVSALPASPDSNTIYLIV